MYWWNARGLAEDLREGRFDKREWWKYFLANLVPWSLFVLLIIHSPGPLYEPPSLFLCVVYLAMVIFGIVFCYWANEEGDNADFILRMICLALPAGVRLAASLAVLFLTIGVIESLPTAALGLRSFVTGIPGSVWKAWTEIFAIFMWMVLVVGYFLDISGYIGFVAKAQRAEDSPKLKQTKWTFVQLVFGLLSGLGLLVMMVFTGVWVPGSDDHVLTWQLIILMLAVFLWAGLFSFVFSRLRQRLKKHASSPNHANQ